MARSVSLAEFVEHFGEPALISERDFAREVIGPAIISGRGFKMPEEPLGVTGLVNEVLAMCENSELGLLVQRGDANTYFELEETYERVRRSEGLRFSLQDRPADIAGPDEKEYFRCLMSTALFSQWAVVFLTKPKVLSLHVSRHPVLVTLGGEASKVRTSRAWCGYPKVPRRELQLLFSVAFRLSNQIPPGQGGVDSSSKSP